MDRIREYLIDNGYEFWDKDTIDGHNAYLKILVLKQNDGRYLVRNAIKCFFDRWANSGVEYVFDTEDEVMEYFGTHTKCIADAVSELTESIIEEAAWNKDYSKVNEMIDFLYDLIYR